MAGATASTNDSAGVGVRVHRAATPRTHGATVTALRATGTTSLRVGASEVRATLPAGSTGTAVLSVPAIAGWSCDGRPASAHPGLVAVPLDGRTTSLTCVFRPPGLPEGTAVAGAALTALLGLALPRRRQRT
ncbi:hypothetical protein [Streptomyces sp. NPDC002990]